MLREMRFSGGVGGGDGFRELKQNNIYIYIYTPDGSFVEFTGDQRLQSPFNPW